MRGAEGACGVIGGVKSVALGGGGLWDVLVVGGGGDVKCGGGWASAGRTGRVEGLEGAEGAKKRLHIGRFRGKMSKLGNFHFGDSKYTTTRVLVDGDGDYGWYVLLTEGNG